MGRRQGGNFGCVALRERLRVETTRKHLWSGIDAAIGHVLVENILAFGIQIPFCKVSLDGGLNSSSES